MQFISHYPAETEALGGAWGREARTGWVIALSGDLGAGKTQLVKGIALGLGINERVHSPTFTLVNEYGGGRLALFHLDLYRLETRQQIFAAGLEEYLTPAGVTVIEWAERLGDIRSSKSEVRSPKSKAQSSPACFRRVQIDVLNETERRISYEDFGG